MSSVYRSSGTSPQNELPFIDRDAELISCAAFLESLAPPDLSRCLEIVGHSGTGKTSLYRRLVHRLAQDHHPVFSIYLDVPANDFQASKLFTSLLSLAWNSRELDAQSLTSVLEGQSFSHYAHQRKIRSGVMQYLHQLVDKAAEWIPGGGAAVARALPEPRLEEPEAAPAVPATFVHYIEHVAKKGPVFLALDNYQFLDETTRLLIEAQLGKLRYNVRLTLITRVEDDSAPPRAATCFSSNQYRCHLDSFDRSRTREVIAAALASLPTPVKVEQVAEDCYIKTNGNLKEVEFYLSALHDRIRDGIEDAPIGSLLLTIGSLPTPDRYVVALAALFPGGLRLSYISLILRQLLSKRDLGNLDVLVQRLVDLGYVTVNTKNSETLKPGHEKIVTAVRSTLPDEDLLELRQASIQAFDSLPLRSFPTAERSYVLACFLGLLTVHEARARLDLIIYLIDSQHREQNFYYLVRLYRERRELIEYLPESNVRALLDAFQKTSEFYLGLDAIQRLKRARFAPHELLDLYTAKYLNQTYQYEDALEILDRLPRNDLTDLYRLNILQCMCRDDEAKSLLEEVAKRGSRNEYFFVILRNSAHYFPFEVAVRRMEETRDFFRRWGSAFGEATCLNNLAVVYAWKGWLEEARSVAKAARDLLAGLASNEVYQPIINLGVLHVLFQEYDEAMEQFEEARRWVPPELELDVLVIDSNILIVRLARSEISRTEAEAQLQKLYERGLKPRDPRLRDQLGYNLAQVRAHAGGTSRTASFEFESNIDEPGATGFEVRTTVLLEATSTDFLLILSPHWRY